MTQRICAVYPCKLSVALDAGKIAAGLNDVWPTFRQ